MVVISDNANWWGWIASSLHHGGYEIERKRELDKHYALFTPAHLKNWLVDAGFGFVSCNYLDYEKRFARNLFRSSVVKAVNNLLKLFSRKVACPQIRVVGVKIR